MKGAMEEMNLSVMSASFTLPHNIICLGIIFIVAEPIVPSEGNRVPEGTIFMHDGPIEQKVIVQRKNLPVLGQEVGEETAAGPKPLVGDL